MRIWNITEAIDASGWQSEAIKAIHKRRGIGRCEDGHHYTFTRAEIDELTRLRTRRNETFYQNENRCRGDCFATSYEESLAWCSCGFYGEPAEPGERTESMPGTPAKVEIIAQRIARNESSDHPGDETVLLTSRDYACGESNEQGARRVSALAVRH